MPTMLRIGSNGLDVRKLQDHLNRSFPTNLPRLKEDGIYGPKTLARVKEYQARYGLVPDGIVGPKTEETLIYTADRRSTLEASLLAADFQARRLADRIA